LTGIELADDINSRADTLPKIEFTYQDGTVGRLDQKNGGHYSYDSWERPFLKTVSNNYGGLITFTYKDQTWHDGSNDRVLFQVVDTREVKDQITGLSGLYHYAQEEANIFQKPGTRYVHYGRFFGYHRVTVTDPLDHKSRHIFYNGDNILNGYQKETQVYGKNNDDLYLFSEPTWKVATGASGWGWPEGTKFVYRANQKDYRCSGLSPDDEGNYDLPACLLQKSVFEYDVQYGQMTPAEKKLWARLSNRQLHGLKFRRQHFHSRFLLPRPAVGGGGGWRRPQRPGRL
jgi:hypothetical protein